MGIEEDSIIAVIGAGAMGSGIAQIAAQAGHKLIISDSNADALERSRAAIIASLEKLVARGKMTDSEKDDIVGRITWTSNLGDVAEARLVIEAIIENIDIKAGLFTKLANIVSPETILASNTSSLSINDMAATIDKPERFVGLHFFNPVPVMKLVEIIPGASTNPNVTSSLLALMKRWGKIAVLVRDVPGFIVNRVARPYYAEGFAAWGEGIDPALIDRALEGAGGFRMGPLVLADMIGHDVNYVVARSVYDAYDGKTRFRPQPSQQALFEAGMLGSKSGNGVYDYSVGLPEPAFVAPMSVASRIHVASRHEAIEGIMDLARAAGLEIVLDASLEPDSLRVDEAIIALGDGRLLAKQAGVDVLLDLARDYGKASCWVITAQDDQAAAATAGFAESLGKKVLRISDRPGQIVLRTMAQLANAAADAVMDDVASAEDVDAAMRYGANHPEGPLEWAEKYGMARVANVLDHIAEELADDMYRPSLLLRNAD